MMICLDTIDKVKGFVNQVRTIDAEVELGNGKSVIDAKSILGIFSMNLLEPLTVIVKSGDAKKVYDAIKRYAI